MAKSVTFLAVLCLTCATSVVCTYPIGPTYGGYGGYGYGLGFFPGYNPYYPIYGGYKSYIKPYNRFGWSPYGLPYLRIGKGTYY